MMCHFLLINGLLPSGARTTLANVSWRFLTSLTLSSLSFPIKVDNVQTRLQRAKRLFKHLILG